MRKFRLFSAAFLVSSIMTATVWAQEPQSTEEEKIFSLSVDLATTYYWRGIDVHKNKDLQDGNSKESIFNPALAMMFDLGIATPIPGLSLGFWSSVALLNREDKGKIAGLSKVDEIDLTASYEFETKYGTPFAGLIIYVYPSEDAGGTYLEGFGGYVAPSPYLNPTLALYFGDNTGGSSIYLTLSISETFEFSIVSFSPGLIFGMWDFPTDDTRNLMHLDLELPFSVVLYKDLSFNFSTLLSYRFYGKEATDAIGKDFDNVQPFKVSMLFGFGYAF